MRYKSSISFSNRTDKLFILHLEPWGEQIPMPPDSTFQIMAEAKEPGEIEIEHGPNDIVVWAWTDSTLKVLSNGKEIGDEAGRVRPKVPPVPKGMKVSSFLRLIGGHREEQDGEGKDAEQRKEE
jgi:hypothetical protein